MYKYKSYRLLVEKSTFASYQKIKYEGFKILYSTSDFIHYQIDTQVIRKLKLKKLDTCFKRNSIEERLSQLLNESEEKEEKESSGAQNQSNTGQNRGSGSPSGGVSGTSNDVYVKAFASNAAPLWDIIFIIVRHGQFIILLIMKIIQYHQLKMKIL
jgi:hypothetical protein